MKAPKERLEARVQAALTAIDAIASESASPQYQTTVVERHKIRHALRDKVDSTIERLEHQAGDEGFKL